MATKIGIVGATGVVGGMFLSILEEYKIDCELKLFASSKSAGKKIRVFNKVHIVESLKDGCFEGLDFCLFSGGKEASVQHARRAIKEGAVVIDNSSAFRMTEDVPLIIPECNIELAYHSTLIANPNCSTTQAVIPLKALFDAFGLLSVEYTTYQSVSGSGAQGVNDLIATRNGHTNSYYPHNISETVIPEIDVFVGDGYTLEEHKMINETKKILNLDIPISATCVRVPIERGHVVQMKVVLNKVTTVDEVKEVLSKYPGLVLVDNPGNHEYPTTVMARDNDLVYVGRIRKDKVTKNAFLIYTASDNLRKGAASNTIQIMQRIMEWRTINESS